MKTRGVLPVGAVAWFPLCKLSFVGKVYSYSNICLDFINLFVSKIAKYHAIKRALIDKKSSFVTIFIIVAFSCIALCWRDLYAPSSISSMPATHRQELPGRESLHLPPGDPDTGMAQVPGDHLYRSQAHHLGPLNGETNRCLLKETM